MIPLFIGLTIVNLLCLGVAAALGYAGPLRSEGNTAWHMLAGVLATLTCCAVHCVVFTYFIATAKWIQHAVSVKRLDPALEEPTHSFKAQAFPAALLAMGIVFCTAMMGAATENYGIRPVWHHSLALASIGVNVIVAVIEGRAIARNGKLIDDVLSKIAIAPDAQAARV